MKKIFKICVCLLSLFLYTSCFEIYVDGENSNLFTVKGIMRRNKTSEVKYILANCNGYRIYLYDDAKKYNINDTLVLSKFSK